MANVIARPSLLPSSPSLLDCVERFRVNASGRADPRRRAELGQFFTPAPLARFMANLVIEGRSSLSLLDPGAGVGSLSAAIVSDLCQRLDRPDRIDLTAYAIDPMLIPYLHQSIDLCTRACKEAGIAFEGRVPRAGGSVAPDLCQPLSHGDPERPAVPPGRGEGP
jgi:adenine-specific DNA-methyltransferase